MDFSVLSAAAADLVSADKSKVDAAFAVLQSVFMDVDLPAEPMKMSDMVRADILRQASAELQAEFDTAASSPPASQEEMALFGERVDGLWRMAAAACPDQAARLGAVLDQLAEYFVQSLAAGGIDPADMLTVLTDENDPRHAATVAMLMSQGVRPHLVVRRLST